MWTLSHRADPRALPLADAHYNRQHPGTPQFVPPGRCTVLLTPDADALWVSSWPFAAYVKHAWPGAWMCSCFRNESGARASTLILEAVAVTRWVWPAVPALGMITFVDPRHVRPIKRRGVTIWGWTFRQAGFEEVGATKGGLVALQLLPGAMPEAVPPTNAQLQLWREVA